MPYIANIPQAPDRINQSQAQILNNFIQLQADFGVNHVSYNALANVGKHNLVTFPVQAAIPASVAGEIIIYNKVPAAPYPITGLSELFIQRNGGASPYTAPLTAKSIAAGGGYSYLPSGLVIKFGFGTAVAGSLPVNLNAFGPAYAVGQIPFLTLGCNTNSANKGISYINLNSAGFTVQTTDPTAGFRWIAIGSV